MNSEKVKEIKKALEFQRDGLMYLENNFVEIVYCKDILTLINELESENERIKNISLNEDITVREWLQENQQLKDRIAELEQELTNNRVFYKDGICYPMNCQGALKQFAERLKGKVIKYRGVGCGVHPLVFDINETLKEFILYS